jgi:hypothetical protein
MKWRNLLGKILVPGLGPWGAKAPDRTGQGRVGVFFHAHSTHLRPRVVGKEARRLLLLEHPEILLDVIERCFGSDVRKGLIEYVRSRCEEEGCQNPWDFACGYCAKRLCRRHAVIEQGQPAYCDIHADPCRRLEDALYIIRSPWDVR